MTAALMVARVGLLPWYCLYAAANSATAPLTMGVAIDVPDKYTYELTGYVDAMSTPGANRSTVVAP